MKPEVLAIAAPIGGINALRRVLSALPLDFPVPILCLQPDSAGPGGLDALSSVKGVKVLWATAGSPLEPGCAYLAPPGTSLIVRPERTLSLAPFGTESESLRPIDLFLDSLAVAFGGGALAVVLSGSSGDAVEGAAMVRKVGGRVIVQEHGPWLYRGASEAIVKAGGADDVLETDDIGLAVKFHILGPRLLERAEIKVELAPVLDASLRLQGTRLGSIRLHDRSSESLRLVVQRGFSDDFLARFAVLGADDKSSCGRALRERHRVVVEDIEADPAYATKREIVRAAGVRSVQSTPVFARRRQVVGVFSTHYSRPLSLSAALGRSLDEYADAAGSAIVRLLEDRP